MLSLWAPHRRQVLHWCLGMVLTLGGVGCTKGMITVGTSKREVIWIVGLDITDSIPAQRFDLMRDQMIPRVVLTRLQSGDVVHMLPIDTDPEKKQVPVIRLTRTSGIEHEIAALFEKIRTDIPRPQHYTGTTNIGGVLAYAKRQSLELYEHRQREQADRLKFHAFPWSR